MSTEEKSTKIQEYEGEGKSNTVSNGDSPYGDVTTLWEIMLRGRRVSGDSRCLGFRDPKSGYSWITYSEFLKRAEHFGSGLINKGMISGQITKIGIYAQNSVEWFIAEYGCFTQSTIVVPLYDTFGPNACSYIIDHADIQIVVCDSENRVRNLLKKKEETPALRNIIAIQEVSIEMKQLAKKKGIYLDSFKNIEELGKESPVKSLLPRASDVSLICYTSGTTGNPKGAVLTHEIMVSGVCGIVERMGSIGLNCEDTLISYLPLAHIFEQIVEAVVLLNGGSVGYYSGNINLLVDDMRVLQPTIFSSVPRLLNKLYEKAQDLFKSKGIFNECDSLKSSESTNVRKTEKSPIEIALYKAFLDGLGGKLRIVNSGGAPISDSVLEFFRTGLGCEVLEGYGLTECGGVCCLNIVTDDSIGSIGNPICFCQVKLVDVPDMGYFSENKQGEVCIKGSNVFKGYFKDPQKTLETLDRDGWLHTGDIGSWLPNGRLKLVDRKKHIFKLSQGEYIAPEKIENAYLTSRFIAQILVHGDTLKNYLVAIVIPDKEAVMSWCKENTNCETWNEICKDMVVKQHILEDMTRLGKAAGLCGFEQVKKIHLHPEALTLEDGFLTPTMKIKRTTLRNHFSKDIDAMYRD